MSARSKIPWTEATWNPVSGCTPVSTGCARCYARRFAERFQGIPGHPYECGFRVRVRPERLDLPRRWKRPRWVFVDSMGDLFHERIPSHWIRRVFDVMAETPHHTYQLLTKRVARAVELAPTLPWPDHLWVGTSIENQPAAPRARELHALPARHLFISLEPLVGAVDLPAALPDYPGLGRIGWVIVGGENGPGARPLQPEWVRLARDQAEGAGVPFFFKGWGGVRRDEHHLDGRLWHELPR